MELRKQRINRVAVTWLISALKIPPAFAFREVSIIKVLSLTALNEENWVRSLYTKKLYGRVITNNLFY